MNDINKLASSIYSTASNLSVDIRLLHEHKTKQGNPRAKWYRYAKKRIAEMRVLLDEAEKEVEARNPYE